MKSNIEKVYSKLPQKKHNLGKHKVDLSVIDEIKKQLTKSEDILNKIKSEENDFLNLKNVFEKAENDLLEFKNIYSNNRENSDVFYQELMENFDNLYDASKEIGIDITNLPAYNDYLQIRENNEKASDINQTNWELISQYS